MLKIKNINTYYGKLHALKNISLHVGAGEIVALIGANGAGKTTILNTISAVTPPSNGEIHFEGNAIHNLSSDGIVRRGISQVPEGRQIFKPLSVEANLELGAYLRYRSREKRKEIQQDKETVYMLARSMNSLSIIFSISSSLRGGRSIIYQLLGKAENKYVDTMLKMVVIHLYVKATSFIYTFIGTIDLISDVGRAHSIT